MKTLTTTQPKASHTIEVYGDTYTIETGSQIRIESRGVCSIELLPSDWDHAEFRMPCSGVIESVAVNVKITGRTFQTLPWDRCDWVKVRIEFVGDGEPSTFVDGWWMARA